MKRIPLICQYCQKMFMGLKRQDRPTRFCSNACARRTTAKAPEERFWSHVERRGPEECWPWTGAQDGHGYGCMMMGRRGINRRVVKAYRVAYELLIGKVPEGLQLDHLCRNPICVNPKHLEPVTSKENTMRGNNQTVRQSQQTHCLRGHFLSKEHYYRGKRQCRPCVLLRSKLKTRVRQAIECGLLRVA